MRETLSFCIFLFSLLCSCSQHNKDRRVNTTTDSKITEKTNTVEKQEISDNGIVNYWDNFNFQDQKLATSADYGEQHFVNFINIFPASNKENITKGICSLIEKSVNNVQILNYFEDLFNRYLYDVNSPFYNEDYYSIALEAFISSDLTPRDSKARYKTILQIINRNKVGNKATNFSFFANGKTQTLNDINSSYIILFFYEPTCNSCKETIHILKQNKAFNLAIQDKALMLAIYPDGNSNIWEQHKSEIPKNWVNGIDLNQNILKKGLYDLKASPTIYVLDGDKKVILKDTDVEHLLQFFSTH